MKLPCRPLYLLNKQDAEDAWQDLCEKIIKSKSLLQKRVPRSYLVVALRREMWKLYHQRCRRDEAAMFCLECEQQCCVEDVSDPRLNLWFAGRRFQDPRYVTCIAFSVEGYTSEEIASLLPAMNVRTGRAFSPVKACTIRQWLKRHIYPYCKQEQAA